jgi:predicted permease
MAFPRSNALDSVGSDVRHAIRRLARDWRFTLGAVLILALGIGVNTSVFSVVNTTLFRKQGVSEPLRIVNIYENIGEDSAPLATSFPTYRDIAGYGDVFAEVAAFTLLPLPAEYQAEDRIRPALMEHATSSYLDVVGLEPAAGRWIDPGSDEAGGEDEVVVGFRAWRTKFDSDPGLIGRVIRINGLPVTVVGIGPEGLGSSIYSGVVTDFWLSMSTVSTIGPGSAELLSERIPFFVTRARLADGVTIAQARAAMDTLGVRLEADYPDQDPGRGITVLGLDEVRVHPQLDVALLPGAAVLLTLVGLVLVLACSNLSTLLLVRGTSRSQEIGVRLALGASRGQLVGHLLTESVALAVAGGIGGFVLAHWTLRLIGLMDLPIVVDFSLDYRVFAFTLGLSLFTGIAFGMAPTLKSTRVNLVSTLRNEGATLATGRRWFTAKNTLLTVQVSVSVILLACTGLMFRSFLEASRRDLGFARDGVAILETDARYAGYDETRSEAVYDELLERIRSIPGVEAATRTLGAPVGDFLDFRSLVIDGYEPADGGASVQVQWMMAGPGYFETLEIPILYGRGFEEFDREDSPPVAVVNDTMARRYFGTSNAVGRRFRYEDTTDWVEIVGVAADVLQEPIPSEPVQPRFYRQHTQAETPASVVIARSSVDTVTLLGAMRRELRAIDPALPEVRALTMADHLEGEARLGRILLGLVGGLALLAMSLASLGLYAVVSYAVTNGFREIGIRMALGARSGQVVRVVARDVSVLVGVGVAIGTGLTVGGVIVLGRLAASASESVGNIVQPSANHPGTFLVVALVMMAVGLLAAYVPARKAAAIDPLEVLRHS